MSWRSRGHAQTLLAGPTFRPFGRFRPAATNGPRYPVRHLSVRNGVIWRPGLLNAAATIRSTRAGIGGMSRSGRAVRKCTPQRYLGGGKARAAVSTRSCSRPPLCQKARRHTVEPGWPRYVQLPLALEQRVRLAERRPILAPSTPTEATLRCPRCTQVAAKCGSVRHMG